ncbi:MAG: nicotinate-nucleotide adenylyltransferase [Clostridiales bacterium]|nr:nicotinate-nucleotide adenylyltransferase [Clostridiales bacterium]
MKKVGIMGGTFNPIHNGHLFLAEHAYEQAKLDYVLFMPTMNPPHKADIAIESAEHRINMVDLAISDNPHFRLSDFEYQRPGMTYTSDTLELLKELEPDTEYYYIVGGDSLMMMDHWMNPQMVFDLATIVTGSRKQGEANDLKIQAQHLERKYNGKVILLDMPIMEMSSENIRERILNRKFIKYYVPEKVMSYIYDNKLYN